MIDPPSFRPRDDTRRRFQMKGKWEHIPLTKDGDPNFQTLTGVKTVFSDDDIVLLVNKALYQLNYQREHHQKRYRNLKGDTKL